jgi:hypothetical protein
MLSANSWAKSASPFISGISAISGQISGLPYDHPFGEVNRGIVRAQSSAIARIVFLASPPLHTFCLIEVIEIMGPTVKRRRLTRESSAS